MLYYLKQTGGLSPVVFPSTVFEQSDLPVVGAEYQLILLRSLMHQASEVDDILVVFDPDILGNVPKASVTKRTPMPTKTWPEQGVWRLS
jgi:hypothetical protein